MRSKFELSISSKYVKDWTYLEAVREFFQNAIDESESNSNHQMNYDYDESSQTLSITNANDQLDINTLLLGETSKSNGNYIGSFGEGYKIGILVLLREGKSVTIYNGPDLWETSFIKSRRYGGSEIPVIYVTKNQNRSRKDLTIKIDGITSDEFDCIVKNNLHLKDDIDPDAEIIHTDYGDLLKDDSEKGRVYVGGLFICEDFELKYGYNFNPKFVSLNRDRNMISSFELTWNASRIIASAFEDNLDELMKSLDSKDTDYLQSMIKSSSKDKLAGLFKEKHGDRIPVSTQEEYNYFKDKGMNPIIVKEKVKTIIGGTYYQDSYTEYDEHNSLYDQFTNLIDRLKSCITEDGSDAFQELIDTVEDYKDDLVDIKFE